MASIPLRGHRLRLLGLLFHYSKQLIAASDPSRILLAAGGYVAVLSITAAGTAEVGKVSTPGITCASWSPDGSRIAAGTQAGTVLVFSVAVSSCLL
jgi:hypothetical protein